MSSDHQLIAFPDYPDSGLPQLQLSLEIPGKVSLLLRSLRLLCINLPFDLVTEAILAPVLKNLLVHMLWIKLAVVVRIVLGVVRTIVVTVIVTVVIMVV